MCTNECWLTPNNHKLKETTGTKDIVFAFLLITAWGFLMIAMAYRMYKIDKKVAELVETVERMEANGKK